MNPELIYPHITRIPIGVAQHSQLWILVLFVAMIAGTISTIVFIHHNAVRISILIPLLLLFAFGEMMVERSANAMKTAMEKVQIIEKRIQDNLADKAARARANGASESAINDMIKNETQSATEEELKK